MGRTPKESEKNLYVGHSATSTHPLQGQCSYSTILDSGLVSVASIHYRANPVNSNFYILDTLVSRGLRGPGREYPFQG